MLRSGETSDRSEPHPVPNSTLPGRESERGPRAIPMWLKVAYTAFVAILVPIYTIGYDLANFLWFSNVALLSIVLILWLDWRLLATMQLVGVAILEIFWTIDFLSALALGGESSISLAGYMFDPDTPLLLRALSLYHIALPILLIWLVWRLGFDDRAWWAQSIFAAIILLICYLFTDPDDNINWAFGFGREPQTLVPSWLYLIFIMIAFPAVVFIPSHALFKWLLSRGSRH